METKKTFYIRLIFFIFLSLFFSLLISFQNISQSKKNITPKAADAQCFEPTGNEQYENMVLPVGPHLAANNSPINYKQIRQLYNCQNKNNPEVAKKYIPVVVVYDLFFLKGSPQGIQNNLNDLKKYGLFPIIRVASYTTGENTWIKLYPPTDAKIMGQNLATALKAVGGFPEPPIVVFFNEVNLHNEWEGATNPEEFSESFDAFLESMNEGNFRLYFPALSYGWTAQIGISPQEFLQRFFTSKKFTKELDGVDLNIYGTDFYDIKTQYDYQKSAFDPYKTYFKSYIETTIGELGPVQGGSTIDDCSSDGSWPQVATQIINGFVKDPPAMATMGCFGSNTIPVIAHYDSTPSQLVSLNTYGQIQNTGNATTRQTINNQPTAKPIPIPTKLPTRTPTPAKKISPTPKTSPKPLPSPLLSNFISLKPLINNLVLLPRNGNALQLEKEKIPKLVNFLKFLRGSCPFPYLSADMNLVCLKYKKTVVQNKITYTVFNVTVPFSQEIKDVAKKQYGILFDTNPKKPNQIIIQNIL